MLVVVVWLDRKGLRMAGSVQTLRPDTGGSWSYQRTASGSRQARNASHNAAPELYPSRTPTGRPGEVSTVHAGLAGLDVDPSVEAVAETLSRTRTARGRSPVSERVGTGLQCIRPVLQPIGAGAATKNLGCCNQKSGAATYSAMFSATFTATLQLHRVPPWTPTTGPDPATRTTPNDPRVLRRASLTGAPVR